MFEILIDFSMSSVFLLTKGKTELQARFDETSRLVSAKFTVLEEVERHSVTSALLQERSHLCFLASCLKPVLVCFISWIKILVK